MLDPVHHVPTQVRGGLARYSWCVTLVTHDTMKVLQRPVRPSESTRQLIQAPQELLFGQDQDWPSIEMIIFDTSVLYGFTRNSAKFDFLRALKHSGSQPAGIPWMVREELVAQQVLEYQDAYSKANAAINGLNRKTPWATTSVQLPARDIERAKAHWHGQYEEVLDTLETSGESARAALAREAFCEKPANTDPKKKGGARDAAIWLSVIDYLKANSTETVYFVSNNTDDFGDGAVYLSPMSEDLDDMMSRLTHLTSFDDCISRFSETMEADSERVKSLLTSLVSDSLTSIVATAQSSLRDGRFGGTRIEDGAFEPFEWTTWLLPPSAVVRNVSEASGHKIGNDEWYTATVVWILVGITQPIVSAYGSVRDISAIVQTACQWRTKVLFSTGESRKLAIVDFETPEALDPNDRTELQPLIDQAIRSSAQSSALFGAYHTWLVAMMAENGTRMPENGPSPDIVFRDINLDPPPNL